MYRRLIGTGLLAAALLALPALDAQAQNKKKGKGAPPGEVIDGANLAVNEVVGKVKATPDSNRHFSLEVDVPQTGAVQNANRNTGRLAQMQAQLQRAQMQMANARNPQQKQQAARQLQNLQRQIAQAAAGVNRGGAGGAVKMTKKEIDFQVTETVKVRTLVMPDQFDEKGNIKKHTGEELAKLRGKDKALPGFESALEKVTAGQKVKVTLAAVAVKAGGKGLEDQLFGDKKRQVKLIVILEEGSGEPPPKKPKKKK